MPDSIRSRYVMAGCIKTHYSEAGGDGQPVILCHGGGPGSSGAAGFGTVIPALGERYQVYAPDGVGGFGLTDPSFAAVEGTQSRVDQLEAFIDTLCLDRVFLGGNSQGAWVAAKYAIEHPDRVAKLVLIGSNTIAGALGLQIPDTEAMRTLMSYDGTIDSMRRVMEGLTFHKASVTEELVQMRHQAANRPGVPEARRIFEEGQRRLTRDPNLHLKLELLHTLPRLGIPSLFVWGEEDSFAPASVGRQVQALLPNMPFKFIPQAGHQVQTDQPRLLTDILIEFFEG